MRRILRACLIMLSFAVYTNADDIDLEAHSGILLKMLRDMKNKTNASESLNLPANASSIRENITDTFSCENRTYGYYADVDNECQLFHVCLPSQTPSGRNVTYRWSFICPNETIFNQEVLTCTRPRDSIPCEESPNFYDLNNEIGKVPPKNDSKNIEDKDIRHKLSERDRNYNEKDEGTDQIEKEREGIRNRIKKRKQDNRKQNIVLDKLFTEIIDEEMKEKLQNLDLIDDQNETVEEIFPEIITSVDPENEAQYANNKDDTVMISEDIEGRLALERNMGDRRSFRFKADV